jgi:hypothetical protein
MNNTELNNTGPITQPTQAGSNPNPTIQPEPLSAQATLPYLDARIAGLEAVFKADGAKDKTDFPITDCTTPDPRTLAKGSSSPSAVAPGVCIAISPAVQTILAHCQRNSNVPHIGAAIAIRDPADHNKRIARHVSLTDLSVKLEVPQYLTELDKQTQIDPSLYTNLKHNYEQLLQESVIAGSNSLPSLFTARPIQDCDATPNALYTLFNELPAAYSANAIWIINQSLKARIHAALIAVDNHRGYALALSSDNPTLFGRPVIIIDYPATTDQNLLFYGDLQSAYAIFESAHQSIVRPGTHASTAEVALVVSAGGVVIDKDAYRVIKLAPADDRRE